MAPAQAPASDTGTRRARTFQCRETLWEGLLQVAGELECTVDFLLNDAVKHYLRQRGRMATPPLPVAPKPPRALERPTPPQAPPPLLAPPKPPPFPPPPLGARTPFPPAPLPPPPGLSAPLSPAPLTLRQPPPMPTSARPPLPPLPPIPPRGAPLPPPPGFVTPPPRPARLWVTCGDRTVEVDRPGFIIGRGKQASGLTIKDPNISRSHAIVEVQDGVHYLVDMGSTNGTRVRGELVARHPIADGDVAVICDHEVRFSFARA
jgi:hypothetical protein